MKIWTCGSSPRSGPRNAWTRIKNFNVTSRLNKFWYFFGAIQIISCRDWWSWKKPGYITMTRRQSHNRCSGGIAAHPAPKNSEWKIRWKISRLNFLGIKLAPSSLIIFQRVKLSTRSITHFCLFNWRTFWRKTPLGSWEDHLGGLFLHANVPADRELATQKKLAYLGFQCLDHPHYSPDLAPSDYHFFPGLKKQLKARHFSSEADIIAVAETCLKGQHSEFFLSALQKLEQQAKKCIELLGVCWINSKFGSVACLLPGRAKDLSIPLRSCCVCLSDGSMNVFMMWHLFKHRATLP